MGLWRDDDFLAIRKTDDQRHLLFHDVIHDLFYRPALQGVQCHRVVCHILLPELATHSAEGKRYRVCLSACWIDFPS